MALPGDRLPRPGEGQITGGHSCGVRSVTDGGRPGVLWKLRGGALCSTWRRRGQEDLGREHLGGF